MARPNLFQQLTRLFSSGPLVKRKIKSVDTTVAVPDRMKSSGALLMQKSVLNTYNNMTNSYSMGERLARFQDFCEMELTPELAAAMDLYADETVSPDEKNKVLHIYSDNQMIRDTLWELFYNNLNIEFNLRHWVRNLCKYGDLFLLTDVSPDHGVIGAHVIPVNEITREEGFDRNDPFAIKFTWTGTTNQVLENWQVAHFRLLGSDEFLPYGTSMVEPARRIWRQLILAEDAMLVYRVTRAPERRVHYVDVGNLPPNEVEAYMEEQKRTIRSSPVIDSQTGRVDQRYNPFSVDEDYWIPVRGPESGTRVDTLAGGQNIAAVEDVAYLRDKLFTALKIPKAYLGYSDTGGSKAALAQLDIRFSRTIQVIQKVVISELNKLAMIHLFTLGYSGEDILNFTLNLSNPSTVATQQKLELWRTRLEIAGLVQENPIASRRFVRQEIWGLTDDEHEAIDNDRYDEKLIDLTIDDASAPEAAGGPGGTAGGGGSGGSGSSGGDDIGDLDATPDETGADEGDEDASPSDEDTPDEPETAGVKHDNGLIVSAPQDDDDSIDELKDKLDLARLPSRVAQHIQYNRSRRRTHGAEKTHTPDFERMTGTKTPALKDPYDSSFLNSVSSNPLADSVQHEVSDVGPISLSPHMMKIFEGLSKHLDAQTAYARRSVSSANTVLSEEVTTDNNEDNELEIVD